MFLPKLIWTSEDNQKRRTVLAVDERICGIMMFDLKKQKPARVCCLVVGENTDANGQQRNQETGQSKIYHLLVLDEVLVCPSSSVPLYRGVGVPQALWVGDLGWPLHEEGAMEDVIIV